MKSKGLTKKLNLLRDAIEVHLTQGIMPFWEERVEDDQHGGFLTNFDEQGQNTGTLEKYLNTQCRLIWWFSTLQQHGRGTPKGKKLARDGVDFLLRHFWDGKHLGWYWKTNRDGSLLDDGKIVYGQSFAIYALSEYYLATGDSKGLEYATQTFDLIRTYCTDTRHRGYFENLDRDWTLEKPGFAGGDRKGLDTHMHLVESFTTLYAASRQEIHRCKLLELVELIQNRMLDPNTGCGLNQFDPAFNSIPAIAIKRTWNAERFGEQPAQPTETTSYSHNLELAWLIHRAVETAGTKLESHLPILRSLLNHAMEHGVDWERGGIFRDGLRSTGQAIVLEKEFWQHAEALVGFLDGYELFGDNKYLEAFEKVWQFVKQHLINHDIGEWRTLLDREGRVLDGKMGNPWKVAYHSGRATVECVARLTKIIARSR